MNKYWIMKLITIVVLLSSVNLSADNLREVHFQKEGTAIWYPNTTSMYPKKAVLISNDVYFPLSNGLAKYNIPLDSLFVYHLPSDSLNTNFKVTRTWSHTIIQSGNYIWFATPNESIWIFDLLKQQFTEKIELEYNEEENPYSNLRLYKDPYTKAVWIKCFRYLYIYEPENNKLTNFTPTFNELGINLSFNSRFFTFDSENVWFNAGSNIHNKGALIRYSKSDEKIHIYFDELCIADSPKRINIHSLFHYENKLYCEVSSGVYYNSIAEYNKTTDEWRTYNPIELIDIIDNFRSNLPKDEFKMMMKTSFFVKILEDIKKKHRYIDSKDVPEDYYKDYSVEEVDKIINEFVNDDDFEILQWIQQEDSSQTFLYNNQLVFGSPGLFSPTYLDFTDNFIVYRNPLVEADAGIVLITDKGLEVLNPVTNTVSFIEGSDKYRLGSGETKAYYYNANGIIYILQITYGHDTYCYLLELNTYHMELTEITPEEDIRAHSRHRAIWYENYNLYVNTHKGIYEYNGVSWEKVDKKIKDSLDNFQPIPSKIILENGNEVLVKYSGLLILR